MILVTGGTGFVGSHVVRRLRRSGVAVRALVRSRTRAQTLAELGVEIVEGDVRDRASLDAAAQGAERVIHLVGIIQEAPGAAFEQVHVAGTRNLMEASRKAGVRHFFYQSSLGTRPGATSAYHRTKWQAEELVRASGIPFTILRPSLIYGPGDQFTIRLAGMIRMSPVLPVIGSGKARVQPVAVEDVVSCIVKSVTTDSFLNGTYEIGGPDRLTYEEVTSAIANAMGVKRPVLHMPLLVMKSMARLFETLLPKPPVTTDQLIMLQEDNVCSTYDITDVFGIEPTPFLAGLSAFIKKETT